MFGIIWTCNTGVRERLITIVYTNSRRASRRANQSPCFSESLLEDLKVDVSKRLQKFSKKKHTDKDRSAVLISLCNANGVPSLLYTLRSQELKNHGGQVSFPGGKADLLDRDVIHTALRETEEEIGIPQSSIDVWGLMPSIERADKAGAYIYPVVGNLGNITEDKLILNKSEVTRAFTIPLQVLCNPSTLRYTIFRTISISKRTPPYRLPVFLTSPRIWGLTSAMTEHFLSIMFHGTFPKPRTRSFSTK